MGSKVFLSVVCAFSFLVIVWSQVQEPDNIRQYYQCWTYAECVSEGSALNNIEECINILSTQEIMPAFKYVNSTFYEYHTDNIDAAVEEYCNQKGDEQLKNYEATFKGIFSYQDALCANSELQAQCEKWEKALRCLFSYLDQLKNKSDCK